MNGTSEAFLHAVANESQLKKSNDSLLLFSLIYVMLNFLLIRSSGVVGLIFANSHSSFSFSNCLPSGWTFLLFSGFFTLILERLFLDQQKFWSTFLLHFSIGLVCFHVSLFFILTSTFLGSCMLYLNISENIRIFCPHGYGIGKCLSTRPQDPIGFDQIN